jgi:Zn finger protein HypA/HybF involved in hydrogenase expression
MLFVAGKRPSKMTALIVGTATFNYSIWCECGHNFQMEVPKSRKHFKPRCPSCGAKTISAMGDYTRRRFL